MLSKRMVRFSVSDQLRDYEKYELILKLKALVRKSDDSIDSCCECVLSGVWFAIELNINEIIHLLDPKYDKQYNRYIVDNEEGFVVKSPDKLVSNTTLMSANYCMRKSWLSSKFSGWTQSNRSMLIGNVVHQLFQDSCRLRVRGIEAITQLFGSNINRFINDFYAIGISRSEVIAEVSHYIPSIADWIQKYLYEMSVISDTDSGTASEGKPSETKLQVMKVRDIEDSVWSTKWGLKGMVDLTVDVTIDEQQLKRRLVMPLELKTGKASFSNEHIGQVILYSIIMEDMTHTNQGLLLYLKDRPQMRQIFTKKALKRDLIQLRNNLVKHLDCVEIGPKPLNNYRVCSKCDHLLDCGLTLKTIETQNLMESTVMSEELIPQVISYLSQTELEFFKKWISLLNLEMSEVKERDLESKFGFWTQSSTEREAKGLGFAKLSLLSETEDSVVFVRSDKYLGESKDFNLLDNMMRRWERVAISIDNNIESQDMNFAKRIALSFASIKQIDCKRIELILDKRVDCLPKNGLFRIDHMSSTGMILSNYTNLLRLMDSNDISTRLRQLIIGNRSVAYKNSFKRIILTKGKHILRELNRNQQKAVLKALSTDSYVLIRGMPGAGKTQTIVALIRLLVALDHSVLITSYTHAAVDNILLKLIDHNIDFLRIGSEKRVDPDLHSYTVFAKTSSFTSEEELEKYYSGVKVVASTCLGVSSHPIFKRRTFDYCIVDEASQVLLPTCLGPLFHCNRFLLVGDPKQLPPLVQSEAAKLQGLELSLFVILQNESNSTDLTIQYRMNGQIMRISNELTYNEVLKCASLEVHNQTLIPSDCLPFSSHNNWLSQVMSTDLQKSVIFLDTDGIPAPEIRDTKGKVYNEFEVKIVDIIVTNCLKYLQISAQQIGVISGYQRQVRLLRESICVEGLDINTVDQFQGRDKEIIVYSCVKSNRNESNYNSEILNDWRRLNVALTRAKKKLVLIGSQSTLVKFSPFCRLFSILTTDQILSLTSSDFSTLL